MFQKEAKMVQQICLALIKNMKFAFPDFGTILPLLLTNFINKNKQKQKKLIETKLFQEKGNISL